MNERARRVVELEAALEEARALAESRRLELVKLSQQLDELLRLAASQNEQLSDLRQMMRRRMGKSRRKTADDDGVTDSEEDPGSTTPPVGTSADPAPAGDTGGAGATAGSDPPKRTRKPRRKGAGRNLLPTHLPIVVYRGDVCACAHCGSTRLLARDQEQRVRLDAAETIALLRRELLEVVRCKDCGRTTTAPPPSLPCPRAKFTCGFLAWLVTMKFVALVPLDRIRRILRSQGVDLAKATLVRLIEIASDLAAPIDGAHWKQLKGAPCLMTDATGLKVLVPGMPKAWDAILDVFNVAETTVYQFALTKHGDELALLLRGFEGVLLCDAESRLNEICRSELVHRANCNAHPRRALRDAEITQPVLAKAAGRFLTRMYAEERGAQRAGLIGAALLAVRQEKIRPIVEEFRCWLEKHQVLMPTDLLGKAVRYYLTHFKELTRFVDDANVPIDNNASERSFQDHAKLRLNSLFAGSPEGGRRWAILLGVATTARRLELDVQAYFTWMFERRGTRRREYGLSAGQLTPAAYQQMLEEQGRQAAA